MPFGPTEHSQPAGSATPKLRAALHTSNVGSGEAVARETVVRAARLLVVAAFGLGAFVRLYPVIGADGPIGDGGLFLAMVDDVRRAGLTIPAMTSYNELSIPFAYPPLGIWVAGALGEITGAPTLEVVRWLPLAFAIATAAAFALLAWRYLEFAAAAFATATYALMPHAYDWLVASGGLTRGLGLTFALLAIAVAVRRLRSATAVVGCGLLLGLAAWSHPQAAIFGALATVIVAAGRHPHWVRRVAAAGAVAFVVVLPWVAAVTARHGLDGLFAAGNRLDFGVGLVRLLNLEFSGAPFMNVFVVPAFAGLVVCIARGRWRMPMLLVVTYVLGAGGGEYLAAVPWSLLAGMGAKAIVELVIRELPWPSAYGRGLVVAISAAVLLLASIASVGSFADRSSKLHEVGVQRLDAMRWAASNLPPGMAAIVPTNEVWGDDELSEWFPAIAGRRSLGTVQGSEWLGADGFDAQLAVHETIRGCAGRTAECYREINSDAALFIPKGRVSGPYSSVDCCPAVRATLELAGYEIVYDGPGATIAAPPR